MLNEYIIIIWFPLLFSFVFTVSDVSNHILTPMFRMEILSSNVVTEYNYL